MTDTLHHLQNTLSTSVTRAAARLSSPFRAFAARIGEPSDLRLHQRRRLMLAFAPVLLIIFISGFLVGRSFRDLAEDGRVIEHAHVVGFQVSTVDSVLSDVEIANRDYLLTGDTADLSSYTAARAALGSDVVRLKALTVNDPVQRERTDRLESLIAEQLALLQQVNDLQAQQRTADAVALMHSAESTQTVESIDALLAQMHAVEDRRIEARLDAATNRLSETQRLLLAMMVMDILLLVALFMIIWSSFVSHERHLHREQEARSEAERAIMLRDQFLSVASHELRTPVTVLLPTVELLERRLNRTLPQDERLEQNFATIHRQLGRLQALIAAMLDVSRIQSGQLSIAHDPLDLTGLTRTVVDEVQSTAQAHTIELITPPGAIVIRGDAVRLSQALHHLMENAVKYSPSGGLIRVEMTRTPTDVAVSVTDQGIGIPADAVPHLFERFYRAPPVRSEHISGMGIGLYVVGEVVALHGGKVAVSSTEGVGSTFTVHLPTIDADGSASGGI